MKKTLLFIFVLISSANLYAYNFTVDGIYYNRLGGDSVEVTYGSSSSNGNWMYYNVNGEYRGSVTIPETVSYNSTTYRVTTIGNSAFSDSDLTEITIPNSVTSIKSHAFSDSSIKSISIPSSVTSVSSTAFRDCSGLTSVIWNVKNHKDFTYNTNYVHMQIKKCIFFKLL